MTNRLLVGTAKGAFLLRREGGGAEWSLQEPLFKGWKATASLRTKGGTTLVATASDVYGPAIHRSTDLASWSQVVAGPAWPEGSDRAMKQVWTLVEAPNGRLYAGVDDAGLFCSDDGGERWAPVAGLNEHPTRGGWYPGAGGLCLHAILVDPRNPDRIWCGISAVGVFRSEDGGRSFTILNEGVKAVIEDEEHSAIGRCVHGLVADPADANRIWRREHVGMYRSTDGGTTWERSEEGLDSWFGFPIARDHPTGTLFTVPLESDECRMPQEGRLVVARSADDGATWERIVADEEERSWAGVLRGAMDVAEGSVYVGTSGGTLHVSDDLGTSWRRLPFVLPRILSVRALGDA